MRLVFNPFGWIVVHYYDPQLTDWMRSVRFDTRAAARRFLKETPGAWVDSDCIGGQA